MMPEETNINWDTLDGKGLVEQLHSYSIQNRVSDIHSSPERDHVRLEVRRNGMIELLGKLSKATYTDYVRRVKFLAKLKLNVTNVPQDGQYTFTMEDRIVNVRTASLPSRFGETLTLRILDPAHGIVPLETLGFPSSIREKLEELVQTPNGLMLVTGPTGSGKTTTLYSLLQSITGTQRNIITLEDPIEYEIKGIVQSEIDEASEYTFLSGLRAILRQDPDVILLGEIRDAETAKTAIDAALTGHLVLATLHTNSAIEAIHRMRGLGADPATLAPALRGVLAQRLIRTLKEEHQREGAQYDPSDPSVYETRTVLPELLEIDGDIEKGILNGVAIHELLEIAKKNNYKTMGEWGNILIEKKITNETELRRMTT